MECVKGDKDYLQVWPVNAEINEELTHKANNLNSFDDYEYDKMYPMVYTDKSKMSSIVKHGYIKKVKAKDLWDKLIHCAWNTAEPGIIFQTKHHNYSPDGVYPSFRGTCTNPCGEIFMNEDSCRLIHINLTSFVKEGKLDEDGLYKTTYETMRLADDLVDLEEKAIDRILDKIDNDGDYGNSEYNLYERLLAHSLEGRRCGLGFTGLADTIALLGYKYDSDEALDMINHIMRLMFIAEMDSEIDMAITRGKFPAYN
jgi:ribonucleoside-diphosphate reductase alpha chain